MHLPVLWCTVSKKNPPIIKKINIPNIADIHCLNTWLFRSLFILSEKTLLIWSMSVSMTLMFFPIVIISAFNSLTAYSKLLFKMFSESLLSYIVLFAKSFLMIAAFCFRPLQEINKSFWVLSSFSRSDSLRVSSL